MKFVFVRNAFAVFIWYAAISDVDDGRSLNSNG